MTVTEADIICVDLRSSAVQVFSLAGLFRVYSCPFAVSLVTGRAVGLAEADPFAVALA